MEWSTWPKWLQQHMPKLEALDGPAQLKEVIRNLPVLDALLGHPIAQVS